MNKPFRRATTMAILAAAGAMAGRADDVLHLIRNGQIHPAASVSSTQVKGFTRLLGGDGWQTTIVLMDLGSTPLAFRQSFLANGNGNPAYIGFIAFYLVCVAVTWVVYLRPANQYLKGI